MVKRIAATKRTLSKSSNALKDVLRQSSSLYPKRRNSGQQEHYEQRDFFKWMEILYPKIRKGCFAVPNGANVSDAERGRLVREGLTPGIPDICIPFPVGKHPGLFIEMKVGKNVCTPEQEEKIILYRSWGWRCEVCYGWNAAADVFTKYIKGI